MTMKDKIQELISASGKKGSVDFNGKEKRKSFDESFGKGKVETINRIIQSEKNRAVLISSK